MCPCLPFPTLIRWSFSPRPSQLLLPAIVGYVAHQLTLILQTHTFVRVVAALDRCERYVFSPGLARVMPNFPLPLRLAATRQRGRLDDCYGRVRGAESLSRHECGASAYDNNGLGGVWSFICGGLGGICRDNMYISWASGRSQAIDDAGTTCYVEDANSS